MRYPQGAAKSLSGNEVETAASQREDDGAFGVCAEADRLLRDFFSRGSQGDTADDESVREDTWSCLFDQVEAAVVRVATVRALTHNEIARKRALQDLMRAHRNILSDHLAVVGQSIERDLRRLLASEPRPQAANQGGWLGWAIQTWKGPRPAEVMTREPERLNA